MEPFNPIGGPLRPNGPLGDLLGREMEIGERASVWSSRHPHQGHTDATLFERRPTGEIFPVDKVHIR